MDMPPLRHQDVPPSARRHSAPAYNNHYPDQHPPSAPPTKLLNEVDRSLTSRLDRVALPGMLGLAAIECILVVFSLLPPTYLDRFGWSSIDGPFPVQWAPVIMAFFYVSPAVIGLLARRWEVALFIATLPAWAGIGAYSIASSAQNGIFSLTSGSHPSNLVGVLELFAILGGFGWLVRRAVLERPSL